MPRQFTGIHAVLYALFDADGSVWREGMSRQTAACLDAGVAGIVVLGLATEVAKLTEAERFALVEDASADIAGRAPLGVTIYGNSIREQVALLRQAERCAAAWVILQPPAGNVGADEMIRFFGAVAGHTDLPVAVQNAPALMGRGLAAGDIETLRSRHPNITHLKGEMPVLEVERIVRAAAGRMVVLNGQAGLEMTDNLRAGCRGFVLAPDIIDWAVRVFACWQAGNTSGAEQIYAGMLPEITFVIRSLEQLHTYGKRIFMARAGLGETHDRAPALAPTAFGTELVARYAAALGPFATGCRL